MKGQDCHTGTTDFVNRSDALLGAAKMILHSHRLATKYSCLASTGILEVTPGSTNTVPGTVRFSLDIRAGDDDRLMQLEGHLKADVDKIAKGEDVGNLNDGGSPGRSCSVQWALEAPSTALRFHVDCINCVSQSARDIFGEHLTHVMTSGAG